MNPLLEIANEINKRHLKYKGFKKNNIFFFLILSLFIHLKLLSVILIWVFIIITVSVLQLKHIQ